MTGDVTGGGGATLLDAILNLSHFHRDHEKFYASSPREFAVTLQRHARTLQALADRWSNAVPATETAASPYAGAPDLNSDAATQLDGVLFMEGEGRPVEIAHMIRDLHTAADDFDQTGAWLSTAMQTSWGIASALVEFDDLAEVLGERHRIIANDWQAAHMSSLIAQLLRRAAEMLDRIDFTPAALRDDLAGAHVAPKRLYSTAEIIGHAADLASDSAGLVHDNERRWRVFRRRVEELGEWTSQPR